MPRRHDTVEIPVMRAFDEPTNNQHHALQLATVRYYEQLAVTEPVADRRRVTRTDLLAVQQEVR